MTSAGSDDEKQPQQHKCSDRKRRRTLLPVRNRNQRRHNEKQPQQHKCSGRKSDSPRRTNPVADQDQDQEPPRPEEAGRETPPADEEPSGPVEPRREETPPADEEPSGPEEPRREEIPPADEDPSEPEEPFREETPPAGEEPSEPEEPRREETPPADEDPRGPEEPRREEMASSSPTGKPSHVSLSPETMDRMKKIQDWPDWDENFWWTYDEEKVRRVCEIQKNMDFNDLLSYVMYGDGEEVVWSDDVRNFPAITQVPEDKTVPPPRDKFADSPADADSGGRASS